MERTFSDTDGLEWSTAVKHIGKQEVEGLDFVIRVIENIQDGPRNTREVIFKTGFAKVFK